MSRFDVLAFDADDTLWHSEDGFRAAEQRFHALLGPFAAPGVDVADALVAMERASDRRRRELGVPVPGEGEAHPFADRPSAEAAAEGTAGTA